MVWPEDQQGPQGSGWLPLHPTHPSVHSLQQAHLRKLDWEKSGGRVVYPLLDGGSWNTLSL